MNDLISIKRGVKATMPKFNDGELGYCTDNKELYIGAEEKNERLCGVNDVAEINGKINNVLTRMNSMDTEIAGIRTEISTINGKLAKINGVIATITARLDALETPEAPSE